MLCGACAPLAAQVSICINLQLYPDPVPVPGYPLDYALQVDSNFFFYDGICRLCAGHRMIARPDLPFRARSAA